MATLAQSAADRKRLDIGFIKSPGESIPACQKHACRHAEGVWQWRALAKAYAAGDEGLEGEYGVYAHIGERTWQRLLEYKAGALVIEGPLVDNTDLYPFGRRGRWLHITAAGRALYAREGSRYRHVDCTN